MRMIVWSGKLAALARAMGLASLVNVVRDALDNLFMRLDVLPLKVKVDDFEVRGFLRHRSFLAGLVSGAYEPFTTELFRSCLKPGMIVIDGGAHVGLYSLIASREVGETGKVFAFEPDFYNFKALRFNIRQNQCRNVIPIRKALSSKTGKVLFYQSPGTISSSLFKRTGIGLTKAVEVEATTLDHELCALEIESALIKLDIEGAEVFALRGMKSTLGRLVNCFLFVEMNPPALRDAGCNPIDLISELHNLGFEVFVIDEPNKALIPILDLSLVKKCNLFAKKRSSKIRGE